MHHNHRKMGMSNETVKETQPQQRYRNRNDQEIATPFGSYDSIYFLVLSNTTVYLDREIILRKSHASEKTFTMACGSHHR